jgi:hypothetical protein
MAKPPNLPEFWEISSFPFQGQIRRSLHRLVCTVLISEKTCAKTIFLVSRQKIYMEKTNKN